ncbi:MAG TPA: cytochrome c biogenesis protein CcdA [Acidimicrobiales bacterium]|nr:cytochrome c biogenesis protein CcdA [Acidimicrobiales bacterium]
MLLLLGVALVAGFVTGISPCILPVLPVVVAGGATGESKRRPYLIIAGLVASFSFFTLLGGSLLSLLHLPQDFLNDAGIAILILLAIGLIIPWVGEQLEKPFAHLGSNRQISSANGFVLGVGLGLVAAPCAGPIFTAVTFAANHHRVGFQIALITLAFAVGMGVPLLVLALLARRASTGWKVMREHAAAVRQISGVLLLVIAVAIAFNWTGPLATHVPGYTNAIENGVGGASVTTRLDQLTGEHPNQFAAAQARASREVANGGLPDLGRAPNFTGITTWLNTPGDQPLTLAGLRGKVVLVDFWTYSCINCQRTLPHVEAWYRDYRHDGFVVVGVHTPEFPFEHVVSNVAYAVHQYGVQYPVAIDNDYDTWSAYGNNYWPAEYLIDQNGIVRRTDFAEGGYSQTEQDIRALLLAAGAKHLPPATDVPNRTPTDVQSPETYLGTERLQYYVGSAIVPGKPARYQFAPSLPPAAVSFSGTWTFDQWEATAGSSAKLELSFAARDVYLVLGGHGRVQVAVDGRPTEVVQVAGVPDLYTVVAAPAAESGILELSMSPGVQAYDFTFG